MKFKPLSLSFVLLLALAAAIDPVPILQKTNTRDYQDLTLKIHLVKTSKTGKERPMDLEVKLKKTKDLVRTLAVFTAPPEVAGISSLSYAYTGKPAERWFKLAGLEWVKCVGNSCSSLEDRFGFTLDIFALDIEAATHKLLGEESVDGAACYKIESASKDPKNPRGARFLTWIDKQKFAARRIQVFDGQGKLFQESHFTAFKELGTHWWETAGTFDNHNTGRGLRFEMTDARINTGIPDAVFARPKLFKTEGE